MVSENCQFNIANRRQAGSPILNPVSRELSRSKELQQRAERYLPGGVNSPVRAFRAVGGDPPFLVRAEGAYLWDADGNRYLDYFGSWGPMILGHAHPLVVEAIQRAARTGRKLWRFDRRRSRPGGIGDCRHPSIEKMRFVSSGTEATMSAIRVARAFTNRKYVIKFEGCYHGHSDGLLVKAGSGWPLWIGGIGRCAGGDCSTGPIHCRITIWRRWSGFREHPEEIAAVIVEPVVGKWDDPPSARISEGLRDVTRREGAC